MTMHVCPQRGYYPWKAKTTGWDMFFQLTKLERTEKHTQLFSKVEHEILVGTLLGDASFSREKRKNEKYVFRLQFAGGLLHYDYISHLHNLFAVFDCQEEPTIDHIPEKVDKMGKVWKERKRVTSRTDALQQLYPYADVFYRDHANGRKLVKTVPSCLDDLLTPRVLAYWYIDDGSTSKNTHRATKAVLNTHSFTTEEQEIVRELLFRKFGLETV